MHASNFAEARSQAQLKKEEGLFDIDVTITAQLTPAQLTAHAIVPAQLTPTQLTPAEFTSA